MQTWADGYPQSDCSDCSSLPLVAAWVSSSVKASWLPRNFFFFGAGTGSGRQRFWRIKACREGCRTPVQIGSQRRCQKQNAPTSLDTYCINEWSWINQGVFLAQASSTQGKLFPTLQNRRIKISTPYLNMANLFDTHGWLNCSYLAQLNEVRLFAIVCSRLVSWFCKVRW